MTVYIVQKERPDIVKRIDNVVAIDKQPELEGIRIAIRVKGTKFTFTEFDVISLESN